jgi:hypothetical protein
MTERFIISAIFLQIIAFLLWIVGIRPYLKKNGLHSLRGVDGLSTVINDIQQALEVSKKQGRSPVSLKALISAEIISFALIIAAVIF